MEKFKEKYRISSARLADWDYGSPGFYFVTICTKNRELFFGTVETQDFASPNANGRNMPLDDGGHNTEARNLASLRHSLIGEIANQYWIDIPKHFPFVELDEYVVMPNHVHGILFLNKPDYVD